MLAPTPEVEVDLPFRVDGAGRIAFTSDLAKKTRNHILMVVGTNVGERVMRGDYGTQLFEHVFDPISTVNSDLMAQDIHDSIADNCPEASVTGIDIDTDPVDGVVQIDVRFALNNDVEETATITTTLPVS